MQEALVLFRHLLNKKLCVLYFESTKGYTVMLHKLLYNACVYVIQNLIFFRLSLTRSKHFYWHNSFCIIKKPYSATGFTHDNVFDYSDLHQHFS